MIEQTNIQTNGPEVSAQSKEDIIFFALWYQALPR